MKDILLSVNSSTNTSKSADVLANFEFCNTLACVAEKALDEVKKYFKARSKQRIILQEETKENRLHLKLLVRLEPAIKTAGVKRTLLAILKNVSGLGEFHVHIANCDASQSRALDQSYYLEADVNSDESRKVLCMAPCTVASGSQVTVKCTTSDAEIEMSSLKEAFQVGTYFEFDHDKSRANTHVFQFISPVDTNPGD